MAKKHYAVVGHPIGHTLSPFIHTNLMTLSGVDGDYGIYDIAPEKLALEFENTLSKQLDGFNATIPHKRAVVPLLDETDETSALYGSVNTVAFTREGGTVRSKGFTTDGTGFELALSNAGFNIGGRAVIVGCGGVGRVFANVCAAHGCTLTILECEEALAGASEFVKSLNERCGENTARVFRTDMYDGESDLLINATPLGMYPKTDGCAASDKLINGAAQVFDAVYNPVETVLVKKAMANGAKAMTGMTMLVYQAAASQTIWNGSEFDPRSIDDIAKKCVEELAKR